MRRKIRSAQPSRKGKTQGQRALEPCTRVIRPRTRVIKPRELVIKPHELAIKPSVLSIKPHALVIKPHELVIKPHELAIKPSELAIKPSELAIKPSELAIKARLGHRVARAKPNDPRAYCRVGRLLVGEACRYGATSSAGSSGFFGTKRDSRMPSSYSRYIGTASNSRL